jgi:transcriptional regulator with GAF, ATPase, and Fis domain
VPETLTNTIRERSDAWRHELNRSVRAFAAIEGNTTPEILRTMTSSMLREASDALAAECSLLVPLTDAEDAPAPYLWAHGETSPETNPFASAAFHDVVRQIGRQHHPIVLTSALVEEPEETTLAEASAYLQRTPMRSAVVVPVGFGPWPTWAWVFGAVQEGDVWAEPVIEHLQVLGDIVASVLHRCRKPSEHAALPTGANASTSRGRVMGPMRSPFTAKRGFDEIVGDSPAIKKATATLEEVVNTDSTVLLLGETGTGKELFARALHAHGPRRGFPLVCVNCGALPPTLIESELFGHQRGAFTGAVALRQGRFELAHRGTLFLDEIGDLPLDLQAKLLRVLQEGAFERVGSSQTHAVDVRIIAATHRDLARAVSEGEFRADLYYRLNVFPIRLPPLRERREDLPALVWAIIRRRQSVLHRHITNVPDDVLDVLQRHSWPGNIRELENVIERALIHSTGESLVLREGSLEPTEALPETGTTLMSVERAHIEEVLRECGWRINGIGNAAERLGLHPNTLRFRMKKLGIVRADARHPRREAELPGRAS